MRSLLFPLLVLLAAQVPAQQTAQYTQYVFNMFSINPAVAGSKDCLDVRMGFRNQWTGFDGAPTTGWASLHGSIRRKGKQFRADRHGFGMTVEADNTGALGYTSVNLAYAYHIQTARDYFVALGLFAGVQQEKLDIGGVNVSNYNDPVLAGKASVLLVPNISPGIQIYSKTSWLGLTIHQALGNKFKDLGTDSRLNRQFFLTGGKRLRISKYMSAVPSTLMKIAPGAPLALDLNVMLEYRRKLGLGMSYRNQDAVAFMIKLPFLKFFTLGYSYDVTTSRLRVASSNTHEIILAIYPCAAEDPNKAIVRCPIFE
ncbi:MAG: type IX secretion system membrane protein PorP/SprF [Flavobacteriales bacterium]